jgi:hypothetical protein
MAEHPAAFVWRNSAQLRSPIIWIITTTTTSGNWSVDYTEAGFINAPVVTATLQLQDADVYDRGFASTSSAPTSTAAAGYAIRGSNLVALGSTTRTVPDGTIVHVMAIGETFDK